MSRRRRHHQIVFGAQSHGFTACSLRLKAASQPTNQGSLPVTGQVLPGGIQTHRVSIETFLCFHVFFHFYLFPSLWALAGATRLLSSRRPMKWDGIPHHFMLGNALLFLIGCLSARTARRRLAPPRTRSSMNWRDARAFGVRLRSETDSPGRSSFFENDRPGLRKRN